MNTISRQAAACRRRSVSVFAWGVTARRSLTVPLSLEDSSKRSRAYPLTQSNLTFRDFPVITGVPPPQGFLSYRTLDQHEHTMRRITTLASADATHHLIAVLGRGGRFALPLRARRLLWDLDVGQRARQRGGRRGRQTCGRT